MITRHLQNRIVVGKFDVLITNKFIKLEISTKNLANIRATEETHIFKSCNSMILVTFMTALPHPRPPVGLPTHLSATTQTHPPPVLLFWEVSLRQTDSHVYYGSTCWQIKTLCIQHPGSSLWIIELRCWARIHFQSRVLWKILRGIWPRWWIRITEQLQRRSSLIPDH